QTVAALPQAGVVRAAMRDRLAHGQRPAPHLLRGIAALEIQQTDDSAHAKPLSIVHRQLSSQLSMVRCDGPLTIDNGRHNTLPKYTLTLRNRARPTRNKIGAPAAVINQDQGWAIRP